MSSDSKFDFLPGGAVQMFFSSQQLAATTLHTTEQQQPTTAVVERLPIPKRNGSFFGGREREETPSKS